MALTFQKLFEKLALNKETKLPVADIALRVVKSVLDGNASILTSETGSGKTLLTTSMLADATDEQVVVLVPRRFLAVNAAETIAELSGTELGKEVGFAIGKQAGDESCFSPDTKLLFTTYGYAIDSGLIDKAKIAVMDEVHEEGIDTSLSRAILHDRKKNGKDVQLLEMSATMDATRQAGYWSDVSQSVIHKVEGKPFKPDETHIKPKSYYPDEQTKELAQVALDLIEKKGRKGIAIFKPGKAEVDETAAAIRSLLKQKGITDVEVETIYGEMDSKDRKKATRPPQNDNKKIIIGTNVIESGVNLPWLDAAISDGFGKVPYFRESGAEALVLDDLPKWRITQQKGRIGRMRGRDTPDIFILFAEKGFDDRVERTVPEIERTPLEVVVMRTAARKRNPLDLKFDANVDRQKLIQAKEHLQHLGLVDNEWQLTKAGRYVSGLPVGPEAGAMLWEAKKQGVLDDAIELAAIIEIGGVRKDFRRGHGLDKNSDVIDSLKAFRAFDKQNRGQSSGGRDELSEKLNVSFKRFYEAKELIRDLRSRHNKQELQASRDAADMDLQRIILAGSVDRLFEGSGSYRPLLGNGGGYYDLERASAVSDGGRFITGELREIRPKKGRPFTLVQNVTAIPEDLLLEFAANRPAAFSNQSFSRDYYGKDKFRVEYFGKTPLEFPIPETPSPAMQKLIEPAYSRFKLEKDAELLTQTFGIPSTDVAAAAKEATTLQEIADRLLNNLEKQDLPVRIVVGTSDPQAGMVRIGSISSGSGTGKQPIHLDVKEGSLSAEQAIELIQKYPAFLQPSKSIVGDAPYAFEVNGQHVVAYSADSRLWNYGGYSAGESALDRLKPALQPGVTITTSHIKAIDSNALESVYFPDVFHNKRSEFSDQDRAEAMKVLEVYKQVAKDITLQATARGTLVFGKDYPAIQWMIPDANREALDKVEDPIIMLRHVLHDRLDERKKTLESVKTAIKKANIGEASIGDGWGYKDADYQMATTDWRLPEMLGSLLRIREIAEIKAPDGAGWSPSKTAFASNAQGSITLALKTRSDTVSRDTLAQEIKEEAAKAGITVESASSYWDQEVTFTIRPENLTRPRGIQSHYEQAIKDKVYWHQDAMQKMAETKQADRAAKEAEALRAKAEEDARRKQEAEARERQRLVETEQRLKEMAERDSLMRLSHEEREREQTATAERAQVQLLRELQLLLESGNGLPSDLHSYQADYRTSNRDEVDAMVSEVRQTNGLSHKNKGTLLQEIEADKAKRESGTQTGADRGSVTRALAGSLGSGGLFSSAKIKVVTQLAGKPAAHSGEIKQTNQPKQQMVAEEKSPLEPAPTTVIADLLGQLDGSGRPVAKRTEPIAAVAPQPSEAEIAQRDAEIAIRRAREAEMATLCDSLNDTLEKLDQFGAKHLPSEFSSMVRIAGDGSASFNLGGSGFNKRMNERFNGMRTEGVSSLSAKALLAQVIQQRANDLLGQQDRILELVDQKAPLPDDLRSYLHLDPKTLEGDTKDVYEFLQQLAKNKPKQAEKMRPTTPKPTGKTDTAVDFLMEKLRKNDFTGRYANT